MAKKGEVSNMKGKPKTVITLKDTGVQTSVRQAKEVFITNFKNSMGFAPSAAHITITSITKNEDGSEHIKANIQGAEWSYNVRYVATIDAIKRTTPNVDVTESETSDTGDAADNAPDTTENTVDGAE